MADAGTAVWAWLAAVNAVAFVAVVVDKRQARRRGCRVPEVAFHGLALAGGGVGGLAAMLLARHKTRKPRFLAPFLLCILAGVAVGALAAGWRPG